MVGIKDQILTFIVKAQFCNLQQKPSSYAYQSFLERFNWTFSYSLQICKFLATKEDSFALPA